MEIVAILPEKMKKRDKKFIESMKKKYDPFLGKATTIKVKLTTLGESLLKTFTEYRPKLIKNEKDIYYFETSEEQAKMYFRGFSKEAEILEPHSLREEIIKEYQEALNIYK